jgi:hypothetical protein
MRKILQKKWENLLWNYNEIIHLLTVKEVCGRQDKIRKRRTLWTH